MAREVIYGKDGFDVVVTWGRDQEYVQVASVAKDASVRLWRAVNQALADVGMPEIDVDEFQRRAREKYDVGGAEDSFYSPFYEGWYVTIESRRALNSLISVLKRARNHAMGADE